MTPRALTTVIIIAALGCGAYYVWSERQEREESALGVTPISSALGKEVPLITITHTTNDDPKTLTVLNIDTPKIQIFSDPVAADRANAYIARFIDDAHARFVSESARGKSSRATSSAAINTFTLNTKVLLTTPRLITLAITESTMLAQIAHPEKYVRYITFDLLQAKVIESKDLFEGTEAMTQVAILLSKLDNAKNLPLDQINQSLLRDDQHALTRDGLLLSIDIGEDDVTSTRSSLEFILPYKTIEQYIKKDIRDAVLSEQENIRMAEPEQGT